MAHACSMRQINLIVIHCSATRAGSELTPQQLDAMHRRRGFNGTGYHYYIRRSGEICTGRPINVVGAHAKGYNAKSVGICYEGGLDQNGKAMDTRTLDQRVALRRVIDGLLRRFPGSRLCGHRDLSPDLNGNGVIEPYEWTKMCPCFDVTSEYANQLSAATN